MRTSSLWERPHGVYRAYDDLGRLLYVGCSVNPDRRMRDHRSGHRGGWPEWCVRYTVEWHPDYARGREAEAIAIGTESPIGNTYGHPSFPKNNNGGVPPRPEWAIVWSGPDAAPWEP